MNARAAHPTPDVLRALGTGKLDEAAVEPVLAHLETCHDCQTQLSGLSGDSVIARLRAAHGRSASVPAAKPARVVTKVEIAADAILPELRNHPDYEVLRELGRGGMGVVYLARNKLMDREEVLKVVNQRLLGQDDAAERFLREIRSAAKLNHPNIVTAYTTLKVGDLIVFAMEYVVGDDLAKVVKDRGPLPVGNACYYIQQAALGLQHACEKGMIHRDIKPGNLILARDGKKHIVKILDFGLAKATREEGTSHDLTGDNKMLGTPDYIAPEQVLDATRADIRADIYSLGCSLHYLLTGRAPFQAKSLYELLQAQMSMKATPVHELRPEVPAALSAVIAKMMAKDPAQRYQTPGEVAKALTSFVKGGVKAVPAEGAARAVDPGATESAASAAKTGSHMEMVIPSRRQETMMERPAPLAQLSPQLATLGRSSAPNGWKVLIGAGIGVAVLMILVLVAGGVFMLRTRDGTIVLENLPPDAVVLVDGEKMVLKLKGDGKPIEIQKAPGKHKLEITRDGFKIQVQEVTLTAGDRKSIEARWVPSEIAAGKAGPGKDAPPPAEDALIQEMKFVLVPRGTFWMGDRGNQRQVEVPRDFYMAAYLVTQGQWQAVMGKNPSSFSRGPAGSCADKVMDIPDAELKQFPVENVSWEDVQEFLKRLHARKSNGGFLYRLPTEAEWEYACRGGATSKDDCAFDFYFSRPTNDLSSEQANFDGRKPAGNGPKGKYLEHTTKVGTYKSNSLGLYDMHGNVWQWCQDLFMPGGSDRVLRGSCWAHPGSECTASNRSGNVPSLRYYNAGFRIVRVPFTYKE